MKINSKSSKKKGINIDGPHVVLKPLKPNVGRLGLQQNMGQDLKSQTLGTRTKEVGNQE